MVCVYLCNNMLELLYLTKKYIYIDLEDDDFYDEMCGDVSIEITLFSLSLLHYAIFSTIEKIIN